ncbi:MAG: thiopurine S-methyltransferase [Pseudomonadota bacterium]
METDFWLARWAQNEIGFHETDFHPMLRQHWQTVIDRASLSDASTQHAVFVPLCGKSRDMLWLMACGFHVCDIELSHLAVDAFFRENNLAYEKSTESNLIKYAGDNVTLWCGDIFALEHTQLPLINLFYDRAALVALPPDIRARYVTKLTDLMAPNAHGLVVSLEYDLSLLNPPPHAITIDSVIESFSGCGECEHLGSGTGEVKGRPCVEHAMLVKTKS